MVNTYVKYPSSGGASANTEVRTLVTSSTSLTMDFDTANVYSGEPSSSATYTMPVLADTINHWFYVKNKGSANITLSAGAGEIYYNIADASFVIYPGEGYKIINDGSHWVVI